MRNFYMLCFLFLSVHMVVSQTAMTATEIETFKAKVKALDAHTKTITSDFTQLKHLSFLDNDIKTEGKLAFKTPNLIKWAYTFPYQYSVIFKDNKLIINDEGDTSNIDMGSNKMFKSLNNIIANSIKGNMFKEDDFTISYFKTQQNILIKFVPKDADISKFFNLFELTFSKTSSDVMEVKMIEPSQDYTKIIFKNKTRNTPVNNEIFN